MPETRDGYPDRFKDAISGVYAIICIPEQKAYVGASRRLWARRATHFDHLRRGKHHCKALQSAFAQHGESAFIFIVIDPCTKSELDRAEAKWMNSKSPDFSCGLYNTQKLEKPKRKRSLLHACYVEDTMRSVRGAPLEPIPN